jgi:hypothetical protein
VQVNVQAADFIIDKKAGDKNPALVDIVSAIIVNVAGERELHD